MQYDVTILGGGPAGATAALVLARAGCQVLLIDRGGNSFAGGECLPPSALPVLRRLDLEAALHDGPHLRSYANQSAWGGSDLWETDFLRSPWGHGWHLDRRAFDAMILKRAEGSGAKVCRGARVTDVMCESDGCTVAYRLADGSRSNVRCRWIVDATGRARVLLRHLSVDVERADRLVAHVGTFAGASTADRSDADTRTLIEAVPDGWWYTARVPGGKRIAIFFTDADLPARKEVRDEASFLHALSVTRQVQPRLDEGGYRLELPPVTRSAASTRARQVVGDWWLAVGDAAVCFDPLSSQGVTTAVRGGEQAANALLAAAAGDRSECQRYAASLDELWSSVEQDRLKHYGMERRWLDREFWRRRASQPAVLQRIRA